MNNKGRNTVILVAVGLIILVGIFSFISENNTPGKYDAFAKCLKDKGAVFYGAFWCPHCQNQKVMFGSSEKFLPYVECSTPDGKGQVPLCSQKNITAYPTWEFADRSRESGEVPLNKLAEKTGCPLPQ
jgi:thiol-disulfide isomerase/thioredoxin